MNLDVIIPVGPGHEQTYQRAVESVRIATLCKARFSKVNIKIVDDTEGKIGRGAARNRGVEQSESEWIFFLDADDMMHPQALENFPLGEYDAVFGTITEYRDGLIMERYQVPRIETYDQLLAFDPYLTLQMGHFVRRGAFKPFDTEMNTGEDWKYYLDLWRNHKCIKVNRPLMVNIRGQHSSGPRSANGREWSEVVGELINEARRVAAMPEKFQWHVIEDFVNKHGYRKGAELGVRWGQTSRYLMENCPDLEITGVDLMKPNPGANTNLGQETYESWNWAQYEQQVQEIERNYPGRFKMLRMDMTEASHLIEDGSLDWVFIDGDHSYEGVSTDIDNWAKKVRPGGVVIGHDINLDTVKRAVGERYPEYQTEGQRFNNCWWVYV